MNLENDIGTRLGSVGPGALYFVLYRFLSSATRARVCFSKLISAAQVFLLPAQLTISYTGFRVSYSLMLANAL